LGSFLTYYFYVMNCKKAFIYYFFALQK